MPIKTALDTPLPAAFKGAYPHTDEHRTLARLQGDWAVVGEWYLNPDSPTPVTGTLRNRGILGGHFIESSAWFEGIEKSRVIYSYDPDEDRFTAFAISALTPRYDLEHGHYDPAADALCFSCVEFAGPERQAVRFERTLSFLPGGGLTMQITYPDFAPERRLGMALRMQPA